MSCPSGWRHLWLAFRSAPLRWHDVVTLTVLGMSFSALIVWGRPPLILHGLGTVFVVACATVLVWERHCDDAHRGVP